MEQYLQENSWVLVVILVWTVVWKGWALWKAARLGDWTWFVVLLIFQTLAILDMLYIFVFSKRKAMATPAGTE